MILRTPQTKLHFLVCAALLALTLAGCPSDGDGQGVDNDPFTNSQTHWMTTCQSDTDCEGGLSCLCGVCSLSCDAEDACEPLEGSRCAGTAGRAVSTLCGDEPVRGEGICLRGCDEGEGCEEGDACIDGACVPIDDPVNNEPGDAQQLCEGSGGRWDEGACGDYLCGEPNTCEALIPGCDCGESSNFVEGQGCVADDACQGASEREQLCEGSGGRWDEGACGDYLCGEPNTCEAIIPGCDCGESSNFVEGQGCVTDAVCLEVQDREQVCTESGGEWLEDTCGDWVCGLEPACDAIIPGCNCGPDQVFVEGVGCTIADDCAPLDGPEALCEGSGGRWDEGACGDYLCGEPNTCEAIIPGCDCGESSNFVEGRGCVADDACQSASEREQLCLRTDGRWDEGACGDYRCGEPNTCEALIPGCDCGPERNFFDGQGCVVSDECQGGDERERLCGETLGQWLPDTCGDWVCGRQPECDAIIPGCNCGEGQVFDDQAGCVASDACGGPADEEQLCRDSGGRWDEGACGHYVCGEPNGCRAAVPGCDCGRGQVFDTLLGCVASDFCPDRAAALCGATQGTWLEDTCGDWFCGREPACDAIIPGCNCGEGKLFEEFFGCRDSDQCL